MRIVQLTTVHRWDDVRIYHKIARTLARAGHDVHLVAPHPGVTSDPEPLDGVTGHWLPMTRSRLARLANAWRAIGVVRRINPDVVHFHDPELMPTAAMLRLFGCRVVYDVHEDLPGDIMQKEWLPRVLRPVVSLGARGAEWLFSRFIGSAVITVTDHIARRFPSRRTVVVQNFPILDELMTPSSSTPAATPPVFVFVGGITRDRGGLEMIEAVRRLEDGGHAARVDLVGPVVPPGFSDELTAAAAGTSAECIGPVPREEVADRLGAARASLVLFHPAPNHTNAQPNKLFEAMSAGVPVIASDFPAWRAVVEGCGCGRLADPLDPESIADAMRWMLEHPEETDAMGRCGREAVEERYNWERESRTLLALYAAWADGRPVA